jgi:Fe-S-cluster containining protein
MSTNLDAISATLTVIAAFVILLNLPSFVRSLVMYRHRDRFKCAACGDCCRFRTTPIEKADVKRLEAAGYKDFYEIKGDMRLRRQRGKCIFLKDDKCSVYEHRPTVCREFPFFKEYGIGYARNLRFCPALEDLEKWTKSSKGT